MTNSFEGDQIARGVARLLREHGYGTLAEISLRGGRRADVMALGPGGEIVIVEVKASETDFRTDLKWPEYRAFCDYFYFAVPADFPRALLPVDCGLIVADAYGGAVLRVPDPHPVHASRRRALLLNFALAASQRLSRLVDPGA